jgi:hypothetical protein
MTVLSFLIREKQERDLNSHWLIKKDILSI